MGTSFRLYTRNSIQAMSGLAPILCGNSCDKWPHRWTREPDKMWLTFRSLCNNNTKQTTQKLQHPLPLLTHSPPSRLSVSSDCGEETEPLYTLKLQVRYYHTVILSLNTDNPPHRTTRHSNLSTHRHRKKTNAHFEKERKNRTQKKIKSLRYKPMATWGSETITQEE